ncbi:PBP1A family penicillin-binding protein [Formicincola oecophyllae]|uniref:Penicillin-binding protein 1A n=1 Tax=Formicincola oecophyllae TaxID=2558361 RepID=A0A4Y6U7F2_9PROT|nr:PBP1A family penicillin-binding protein [Formicincola oecophyllae]QDH13333.1 PBP1A family penicillin-binding protein [Formicincola oecophyllae]
MSAPAPRRPDHPPGTSPRARRVRLALATVLSLGVLGTGAAALAGWVGYEGLEATLPDVTTLQHYHPPTVSRVYANNDVLMAELAKERRIYVPIAAIPPLVRNAFIAAEDQHFYTHHGIDPVAIMRAGLTDLANRHGKRPLGASTITQQVAKGMLLNDNSLSLARKAKEALLALRIEQALPKNRILEIYLDGIYLGNGTYGVQAAALGYFNKPLDQLDVAEAAMLAAMPKSPAHYNPFYHPEAAKERRDWVIDRMEETGAITPAQAEAAKAEPLPTTGHGARRGPLPDSEWFSEDVRRDLIEHFGAANALQGGLDVHTSMEPALQHIVTRALRQGLVQYDRSNNAWRGSLGQLDNAEAWPEMLADKRYAAAHTPVTMPDEWRLAAVITSPAGPHRPARVGWLEDGAPRTGLLRPGDAHWARFHPLRPGDLVMIEPQKDGEAALQQLPQVEGAAVVMEARTGRVLAMTGGWSFRASQFNRVTQALRQPGSSFKPLIYLEAMDEGISPSQKFQDGPISFGDWHPQNYEHNNWGPTTLHDALRESRNLVTIRLAAHLGMKKVIDIAERSGMVNNMPPYLPAALGAVETTVLKEAAAYAAMANGGHRITPSLVDYIEGPDGSIISRATPIVLGQAPTTQDNMEGLPTLENTTPQLASPQAAYQIATMMKDVIVHGTGRIAGAGINQPIGGKTGTSQDYRDAWFAGYSPEIVTVVWVGYDTPRSLGKRETGGRVAGPIWNTIMKAALAERRPLDFAQPEGVHLFHYDTGRIPAVDAFLDDQYPGASGSLAVPHEKVAIEAGEGGQLVPGSEEDMDDAPSTSASAEGAPNFPSLAPNDAGANSPYPTSIPESRSTTAPEEEQDANIGVGGLY